MTKKKSTKKKNLEKNNTKKNSVKKTLMHKALIIAKKESEYKKGLLEVDKQEDKFDKLFEQKLAKQYREFRNLKEYRLQSKKFIRIFLILITVVLIALLLLSYRI